MHEQRMPELRGLGCDLCVNPSSTFRIEAAALSALASALRRLETVPGVAAWIPHVGSNLVVALPGATEPSQVAAVPGRIDSDGQRLRVAGAPAWGASRHVAQIVLAAVAAEAQARAAMNLAYRPALVEAARRLRLRPEEFDASYEGRADALERLFTRRRVPHVAYQRGAFAVEPVAYVLGADPHEVVDRVAALVAAAGAPGPLPSPSGRGARPDRPRRR